MNTKLSIDLIASTQIITESAPISSSGHTTLVSKLLPSSLSVPEWYLDLTHIITLLIIAGVFFSSWWFIVRRAALSLTNNNLRKASYKRFWRIISWYITAIFFIDCVSVVFYFGIKNYVPGENTFFMMLGFLGSALALLSIPFASARSPQLNSWSIIILGSVQGLAALPSLSRMALTYVAAEWLGFKGTRGLELSLAIQIPLILGALAKALLLECDERISTFWPGSSYESWMMYISAAILATILLYAVKRMAKGRILWLWGFYLVIPAIVSFFIK